MSRRVEREPGPRAYTATAAAILASAAALSAQAPGGSAPQVHPIGSFTLGENERGGASLVAFRADGAALATAHGTLGEVLVWRTEDGARLGRAVVGPGLRDLALSPDGRAVATVTTGELRVTEIATGGVLLRREARGGSAIAYSGDGCLLAAYLGGSAITLLDAGDGQVPAQLPLPGRGSVVSLCFGESATELFAVVGGVGILAFDLEGGGPSAARTIVAGDLIAAARTGPDRWVVVPRRGEALASSARVAVHQPARGLVGSARGEVALHATTMRWLDASGRLLDESENGESMALHPDGGLLAVARFDGVELRHRDGTTARWLRGGTRPPSGIAVTRDGRFAVANAWPWPHPDGTPTVAVHDLVHHRTRLHAVTPAPRYVRAAVHDGAAAVLMVGVHDLRLWDPAAGRTRHVFAVRGPWMIPRLSPDGRWLWAGVAGVARDRDPKMLDLRDGATVPLAPGGAQPLAWRGDGRALLLQRPWPNCFGGGDADLWLHLDGRPHAHVRLRLVPRDAQLAPDGRTIAVACRQATVVLDGDSLAERARGQGSAFVRYLDARHVVTASGNEMRVWRADTGEVVQARRLRPQLEPRLWPLDPCLPLSQGDLGGDVLAVSDELAIHLFRIAR